eukprot:TRINITY_DN38226_c0_g1_i1.p1 TRINITY_DN38226_c0_g1~~TRINITY_DN38226_c0_g1_i1.p1  ORF type:complete len:791 (+),score=287.48 TRINITY_DN38226_c0_g1_i1:237-2375(+)
MGTDTVQVYVPWNWHEEVEGEFRFDGDRDLDQFLQEVSNQNMTCLLRLGPYICGEWEFGGFPAWLLGKNISKLRTYDTTYLQYVDRWFTQLLPIVKKHMDTSGGPILMVQVENEFGSYGNVEGDANDKKYMEHLVNITRNAMGADTLIYTTDGGNAGYMKRGSLTGRTVLTLGDGGTFSGCSASGQFNPSGFNPCVNTELYTGWLTHWGEDMANTSTSAVTTQVDLALQKGYSFNLYMGFGGTNFGMFAGANGAGAGYQPHITSYDYDAPLSESAQHGYGKDGDDKYNALRGIFTKHGKSVPTPPEPRQLTGYGEIRMEGYAPLLQNLAILGGKPTPLTAPTTMEVLGQNYGLILYTLASSPAAGDSLRISGYVRDRAQVFVNGTRVPGAIFRTSTDAEIGPLGAKKGDTVSILVEAMGRLNFGTGMWDPKGIATDISLDGTPITPLAQGAWQAVPITLNYSDIMRVPFQSIAGAVTAGPNLLKGTLQVAGTPKDTYISTLGWGKGMVWVNGFNLGRYWEEQGPQHALFVPAVKLREGANDVVVLEMEDASAKLESVDRADFSGHPMPACLPQPTAGTALSMYPCTAPDFQAFEKVESAAKAGAFSLSIGGLCVGVVKDGTTSWAALQKCDSSSTAQAMVEGDKQTVRLVSTGECLDIFQGSSSAGATLDFYPCKTTGDNSNQKWVLGETPAHTFTLQSPWSQKCATACSLH